MTIVDKTAAGLNKETNGHCRQLVVIGLTKAPIG